MTGVAVNTRTLFGQITGVQRYLKELLACELGDVPQLHPRRRLHGIRGHVWEQSVLPLRLRGRLLWSPGNTGPLAVRRQVVTIHDASVLDHPEWFDRGFVRLYRFLLPRLVRRCRRVITVSAFSKERLMEHSRVAAERIVAIHNGVSARFRPVPPAEVSGLRDRLGVSKPYVLAVGSLEPRKNLSRLFAAWARLESIHRDFDLLVSGAPGRVFRSTGFEQPPPGARLLGRADDADLPALYSGAAVFVYPSLYEGFGLPPLEAMACGTPVVCSGGTSLTEVVGEAARLFDPSRPDSIASTLLAVLQDSALQQELRQAGLRRARGFTWEAAGKKTRDVLQEAAAR